MQLDNIPEQRLLKKKVNCPQNSFQKLKDFINSLYEQNVASL